MFIALLSALALLPTGVPQQGKLPTVSPKAKGSYVAILMWHDVVAGKKQVWFDTTADELRSQFERIKRRGLHVISLRDVYRHLKDGTPVPPKSISITFDDNNLGLYENAFPILKQYNYPATFFVHTDYVGVTTDKRHCTWAQLKTLQTSGLIDVESHTRTHPVDMRTLPDAKDVEEFAGSKRAIEQHLGSTCWACSYPNGVHDERLARLAANAGYAMVVMEDWGSAESSRNLMLVHRYSIHKRFAQSLNDVVSFYAARRVSR